MASETQVRDSLETKMSHVAPGRPITSSRIWLEVKDVMSREVITIAADATVVLAAQTMSDNNVSCLVVLEHDRMAGLITERDLLAHVLGDDRQSREIRVAEVMSCPLESVPPELSVYEASAVMETKHIKRLAVAVAGRPVGMVTQTDLTRALVSYDMWKDVAAVMSRNMVVVQTAATVAEAAAAMRARGISCIVVLAGSQVRGILTERDLVKRVIAHQRDPASTRVEEVMSSPVRTILPNDSVFSAYKTMDRLHIRRLVVTENEHLCGIVTQTDVFRTIKKKVQEEEEKNRRLLECSTHGVYTADTDGRITYVNPALLGLLEVADPAEMLDQPFLPERFWCDPEQGTRLARDLRTGNVQARAGAPNAPICVGDPDLALRTATGKTIHVNLTSTFTRNAHGQITGTQGILYDITERKRAEEALRRAYEQLEGAHRDLQQLQSQLVQNEKLAAIGQLAAGVAHEMNTPLGFVASNFETLEGYTQRIRQWLARYDELVGQVRTRAQPPLQDLCDGLDRLRESLRLDFILADLDELFRDSRDGLERVTSIVRNLRDFSRVDQPGRREAYDLNRGIEATLIVARNEIKYDAEVRTDFTELPAVYCHAGQINQVLLNLLVNAAQAIRSQQRKSRGTIGIRTYTDAGQVVCEIADDGPGITPEHLSKIFDPFFTTKPPGKGTGLGLSISYDIVVHKHQGRLGVDSTVGQGTTFTMRLPMSTTDNDEPEVTRNGTENSLVCGR